MKHKKKEPRPAEPPRRDLRREKNRTEKDDIDGLSWHSPGDDWQDRADDLETLIELGFENGWKSEDA